MSAKTSLRLFVAWCAVVLAIGVLGAQDYFSKGGGGGSATPAAYAFSSGTAITETADGVLKVTKGTGADNFNTLQLDASGTFATLKLGTAASGISAQVAGTNGGVVLGRVGGGAGVTLNFNGTIPTCGIGGVWTNASTGIAYLGNQFGNCNPLGVAGLPTVPIAGTSPAITPTVASGGYISFRLDVGTGGTATSASFTLPTAAVGWNCMGTNITARAAHVAATAVVMTTSGQTSCTLENQNVVTGAAAAFAASDVLGVIAVAY